MKIIEVDKLVGNEISASPILTNDYQVLIGKGTVIKKEYIEKLKELNISEVYIEDTVYTDLKTNSIISQEEIKISCLNKIKEVLEKHTYNNNSELEIIKETANEVMQDILRNQQVVERIYEIRERSADMYEHSLSVCSIAILTGVKLGFENEKLIDIGIASLLHDLGLRYITISFTNVDLNSLSEKDLEEYKKHTIYGYTAIVHETWLSDRAKKIILFHHEKLNGLGYPLKTTDTTLECQVVAVCEIFDEMLCGVGAKRVKVHEAIEMIKAFKNNYFDEKVINSLLQFTAVYPTGTMVKLIDGCIGVVVRQSEHFPERPVLRLISDKDGNKFEKEVLCDMVLVHNVFIEKVLES